MTDITAETALQNAKALVRELPDPGWHPGVPPDRVVFHGVTTRIIPFNNVQSCSFRLLYHLLMKIAATTTGEYSNLAKEMCRTLLPSRVDTGDQFLQFYLLNLNS